jgi:hypothetical protein
MPNQQLIGVCDRRPDLPLSVQLRSLDGTPVGFLSKYVADFLSPLLDDAHLRVRVTIFVDGAAVPPTTMALPVPAQLRI